MWLFRYRLTELEEEFTHARESIKKLQRLLEGDQEASEGAVETPDRAEIKLRLEVAVWLVRIIKEQTAFYIKLKDQFDMAKLLEDLVDELSNEDSDVGKRVLETIDKRWFGELSHFRKTQDKPG